VIYSYYKSQRDALFLKFIFDKELYMFRTDLLSIIRGLQTVYAAKDVCHAGILKVVKLLMYIHMYIVVKLQFN
jgi:hypothetical protein